MEDKDFLLIDKGKTMEIMVNASPDVKSLNAIKSQLMDIIGTKDLAVIFGKGVEIDFINFQFFTALKKWQGEKGRAIHIKDLNLRSDHPVMISGGNSLLEG